MPRYDIFLDGQGYILDPEYGDKAYIEMPQENFPGKDPTTFWQAWAQRSWHGGERQETMLSADDVNNFQYHDGENLVLSDFGKATLQPALVRDVTVQSTSMPMVVTTNGASVIVGLSVSPYVKIWTNGSWANASSVAGSGAVTDIVVVGTTLYAVRGGAVLTSTNNGDTWTNVQYTPRIVTAINVTNGGADYVTPPTVTVTAQEGEGSGCTAHAVLTADAVTSVVIDSAGTGYTHTPQVTLSGGGGAGASAYALVGTGTAASFTTATGLAVVNQDLYVGKSSGGVWNQTDSKDITSSGGVTSIAGYKEDLFWIENRLLWRYNGKAAFVYDELPSGFVGTCLFSYRQVLFVLGYYKEQGGYRGAVYYVISGNENHLYSVGDFNADHRIYAACGGDDEVWFVSPDRGGMDRYDLTWGGLTCGPAWGTHGTVPFKAAAYCDGYLFVGRYDNVVGTDGIYVADLSSPSAYVTSGYLTSSEYDFEFANDEKILSSIGLYHRALAVGQSLTLHYSLDGGDTWMLAGVSDTVGATKRVFEFSTLRFDTIKVKVTLTGPGTSTPTLKKVLIKACAVSQAKWKWTLRILADRVASRSGRTRRGYEAVKKLKDTSDNQLPVQFLDRIGGSHTVLVEACEIDQEAVSKRRAYLTVLLREV